eukprot:CAMPEP_0175388168 /NCGR_PEP_ID=MMETSP0095-20121207/30241_1 /TAXON_ID=311494 /ORGANISM="Alexandrium monilatum, Strain CCMP3105" /LENGTH=336 /DNA_ID=CAMNT_0016686653 /DNA_START=35 /DNA_END=1041 /DNA_ORIENTATION=-
MYYMPGHAGGAKNPHAARPRECCGALGAPEDEGVLRAGWLQPRVHLEHRVGEDAEGGVELLAADVDVLEDATQLAVAEEGELAGAHVEENAELRPEDRLGKGLFRQEQGDLAFGPHKVHPRAVCHEAGRHDFGVLHAPERHVLRHRLLCDADPKVSATTPKCTHLHHKVGDAALRDRLAAENRVPPPGLAADCEARPAAGRVLGLESDGEARLDELEVEGAETRQRVAHLPARHLLVRTDLQVPRERAEVGRPRPAEELEHNPEDLRVHVEEDAAHAGAAALPLLELEVALGVHEAERLERLQQRLEGLATDVQLHRGLLLARHRNRPEKTLEPWR